MVRLPAVFRESATGLVRTAFREIVVRFSADVPERLRNAALRKHALVVRRENAFVPGQVVVAPRIRTRAGSTCSTSLTTMPLWTRSCSQPRTSSPSFAAIRLGRLLPSSGTSRTLPACRVRSGREDIGAVEAWKTTTGTHAAIVIAIVDDGVDVDHPDLKTRIWRNRDSSASDRHGRDFFLPDNRSRSLQSPPEEVPIPVPTRGRAETTSTARLAQALGAAAGNVAFGGQRGAAGFFPSRSSTASELAADERVADAIRYAASDCRRHLVLVVRAGGAQTSLWRFQDVGAHRPRRSGVRAVFCSDGQHTETGEFCFPASDPKLDRGW